MYVCLADSGGLSASLLPTLCVPPLPWQPGPLIPWGQVSGCLASVLEPWASNSSVGHLLW